MFVLFFQGNVIIIYKRRERCILKQDEIRARLIEGTVRIIARDGLDKASTKQIETETGINVVYIYRCFKDKDDLLAKVFRSLDQELIREVDTRLPIMAMPDLGMEERCRILFFSLWGWLLGNREKCLCYRRYYYSSYFLKYSIAEHKSDFRVVVEKMSSAFKEEADVWMILNHVLNVMLDFAVKVFQGEMPKDDDYSEHVFRVVYHSVTQYFKPENQPETV